MQTKTSKKISKKDKEEVSPKEEVLVQVDDVEETKEEKIVPNVPESKPTKKSIVDFDHDEIIKLDTGKIKDTDSLTLLKILLTRGESDHNPALMYGTKRLLKQLNFEDDTPREPRQYHFRNPRDDKPFPHNELTSDRPRSYQRQDRQDRQDRQGRQDRNIFDEEQPTRSYGRGYRNRNDSRFK